MYATELWTSIYLIYPVMRRELTILAGPKFSILDQEHFLQKEPEYRMAINIKGTRSILPACFSVCELNHRIQEAKEVKQCSRSSIPV